MMQYPMYRQVPMERGNPPVIKVFGKGTVSVQPNQAVISLGVVTEDQSLTKALEDNARSINSIKTSLRSLGIPNEQIQTENYSIFPQYDYINGKQEFRDYRVEHILRIQSNQIQGAGNIVDEAVKHGANTVRGIQLRTTNEAEQYQKALSKAVLNATKNAQTIAQTLNVQLAKRPKSVKEIRIANEGPIPYGPQVMAHSAESTTFEPGVIEIKSEVEVEFHYFGN